MSVALGERGFQVDALDNVPEMRRLSEQAVKDAGLAARVSIAHGNAYKLELPDNSYDVVVALGVLPWLRVPERVVSELTRVLKPGGYVVVSADNHWRLNHLLDPRLTPLLSPVRRGCLRVLEMIGVSTGGPRRSILRLDRAKSIDSMVQRAGLRKVKGTTLGFGPFSFLRFALFPEDLAIKIDDWLQSIADRNVPMVRATGAHYLVLARRTTSSEQ